MYNFVPTSTTKLGTSENPRVLNRAIPSVMSASGVTKIGETSDGSTAARLEVARPKSPTAHHIRKHFEDFEDGRTNLCNHPCHLIRLRML
jgi:hypothetical protein